MQEQQVSEYAGVCAILDALDISPDLVYGYSQPWDPIPRLFTQYDPLYPLIDDLGEGKVLLKFLAMKPDYCFRVPLLINLWFRWSDSICIRSVKNTSANH